MTASARFDAELAMELNPFKRYMPPSEEVLAVEILRRNHLDEEVARALLAQGLRSRTSR